MNDKIDDILLEEGLAWMNVLILLALVWLLRAIAMLSYVPKFSASIALVG